MCGLAGMAGPDIVMADLDFLQELSYVSGLRGQDGTGIIQGETNKKNGINFEVEKSWMPVNTFMRHHRNSKNGNRHLFNSVMDNFFLVHVRAATRGGLTTDNAHPFEFKSLIGMHNGTLRDASYTHAHKTDSEMMFSEMDREGIIPTLSSLHKDSAWAVTILDKTDGNIIMGRNVHRPLCIAANKNRSVVYWASEAGFLHMIAARNGIKLEKVYELTANYLYKFNPRTDVRKNQLPDWSKKNIFDKTIVDESSKNLKNLIREVDKTGKVVGINTPVNNNTPRMHTSNLIPAAVHKPNKGPAFNCWCTTCGVEMTLYDQYKGQEIHPHVYNCEECVKSDNAILSVGQIGSTIH